MLWFLLVPFSWYVMYLVYLQESAGNYPLIDPFPAWTVLDFIGCVFFASLISLAVLMTACMAASGVGSLLDAMKIWRWVEQESETLIAVRDKDGVKGSMSGGIFIFSGSVNSSPYYFYYTQNEDGSYEPGKIEADGSVKIFETDEGVPRLVRMQMEHGKWWPDLLGFTDGPVQYHFYVPKGTVRREMSV